MAKPASGQRKEAGLPEAPGGCDPRVLCSPGLQEPLGWQLAGLLIYITHKEIDKKI